MCLLRIFGSFLRLAFLYNVNPLPESQEMLQKSGAIISKSAEALLRGCVLTQCSTSRQNRMHFIPLIILFLLLNAVTYQKEILQILQRKEENSPTLIQDQVKGAAEALTRHPSWHSGISRIRTPPHRHSDPFTIKTWM